MENESFRETKLILNEEEEEVKLKLMSNSQIEDINKSFTFTDTSKPIHFASLFNNIYFFSREDLTLCDLEEAGGYYKSTPLIYACYNSCYKVLFFLLSNNVDIFYKNNMKTDALKIIIKNDDVYAFILLMLFINRKVEDRYVKYILKKKFEKIIRFLEIHHESIPYISFNKKKCNRNTCKIIWYDLIFIYLLYLFQESFYFKVILLVVIITFYFKVLKTRVLCYVNIYYKVKLLNYLKNIKHPLLYLIYILQVLFFIILIFPVKKNKQKNFKECRTQIIDLIYEESYNKDMFCYSCLNVKKKGTKHCSICDGCIIDHDHHCPFLKNCITSQNYLTFSFYICISIFLNSSLIYYTIDTELIVVDLFYLLAGINIINKIQQDHRRKQGL